MQGVSGGEHEEPGFFALAFAKGQLLCVHYEIILGIRSFEFGVRFVDFALFTALVFFTVLVTRNASSLNQGDVRNSCDWQRNIPNIAVHVGAST